MHNFRFTQFVNPHELLEALAPYDDSFMNFAFGALVDSIDDNHIRVHGLTEASRKLFAVYAGDTLLYVFVVC